MIFSFLAAGIGGGVSLAGGNYRACESEWACNYCIDFLFSQLLRFFAVDSHQVKDLTIK